MAKELYVDVFSRKSVEVYVCVLKQCQKSPICSACDKPPVYYLTV